MKILNIRKNRISLIILSCLNEDDSRSKFNINGKIANMSKKFIGDSKKLDNLLLKAVQLINRKIYSMEKNTNRYISISCDI